VDKAKGYGMEGVQIDGNNILTVYDTVKGVREYCIKNQKPYLIECMTFRMRGHEEASGTKYVPIALLDSWKQKDPVKNYEEYLFFSGVLDEPGRNEIYKSLKSQVDEELDLAGKARPDIISVETELNDVYAGDPDLTLHGEKALSLHHKPRFKKPVVENELTSSGTEKRLVDAISEALRLSMQRNPKLVLMGQDIAEYGGAFKITEGFVEEFGKQRVRNTPLCESAIIGAALGLSLEGFASVVEMQFSDFVSVGFNQIVNNLAKIHYRWGQPANTVIRMPTGAGVGAGPFHSQSTEAWFMHVPGLKIVYPSNPYDAKGLLISAINDPGPVMYFEHKALYRSITGPMPEEYYEGPIGKASLVKE
jgi:2-oxoisovalerate dehydrogenase E1 component